jgi:hypothetical protein
MEAVAQVLKAKEPTGLLVQRTDQEAAGLAEVTAAQCRGMAQAEANMVVAVVVLPFLALHNMVGLECQD